MFKSYNLEIEINLIILSVIILGAIRDHAVNRIKVDVIAFEKVKEVGRQNFTITRYQNDLEILV